MAYFKALLFIFFAPIAALKWKFQLEDTSVHEGQTLRNPAGFEGVPWKWLKQLLVGFFEALEMW